MKEVSPAHQCTRPVREWLEQKDTWVPGVPSVPITTDYQELVHSIPLTDPPVLLVLLVHLVQMERRKKIECRY